MVRMVQERAEVVRIRSHLQARQATQSVYLLVRERTEEAITRENGKRNGLETSWYENGQKEFEATYKDYLRNGLYTLWYENKQKRFDATYKDGELISSKEWDEDGNLTKEDSRYNDGDRLEGLIGTGIEAQVVGTHLEEFQSDFLKEMGRRR